MKIVTIAALVLALAGCAGTTPRIDPARLSEVQKGKTTVAEVLRQFGNPSVLSKNTDGTQWAIYLHGDPQSEGTSIVPLAGITPRDSVTFYFDARGVLTDIKATEAGSGHAPSQAKAASPEAGDASPKPGSSQPAKTEVRPPTPAGNAPQSGSRSSRPGWLPPSTIENR